MVDDRKINITIGINGKKYPTTISASEEEAYRKASKQVENSLKAYQERFKKLTIEDCLGLVAFQFALEKLKLDQEQSISEFVTEIERLNDELNDYLAKD
ncbi:MAG: cell division protein ZapA [Mangrovibacterium sp.]